MDDTNMDTNVRVDSQEGAAPVVQETKPAVVEQAKPDAGKVVLTAEQFGDIMSKIKELETSQSLLLQVQDKDKIGKIEAMRRSGKLVKSVKIHRVAGKYVLAWKSMQDEVYRDELGRLVEKQVIRLFFDDKSETDMTMRQWANASEYVPFEVKAERKNEDGDLFFIVQAPDGKEMEINASFIN